MFWHPLDWVWCLTGVRPECWEHMDAVVSLDPGLQGHLMLGQAQAELGVKAWSLGEGCDQSAVWDPQSVLEEVVTGPGTWLSRAGPVLGRRKSVVFT